MNVPVDAKALCIGGECGRVMAAILNPVDDSLTHVVVREPEPSLFSRLVPIQTVLSGDSESIRLGCTREELGRMEVFSKTEFIPYDLSGTLFLQPYAVPLAAGIELEHEKIPAGELAVRRGFPVEARDGRIGTVDEFIVEPAGFRITHLVLRKGHLWDPRDVAIPVSRIDRISERTVYLAAGKSEIEALPAVKVKRRWS